jgi:hypothetical protein
VSYHRTQERLITPPAVEPISITEAQQHLRLEGQFDADYVMSLITIARHTLEKWCWSAFVMQTWQYWFDRFWWEMFIPRGPMRVGWNAAGANDPMRPQEGTNCGGIVWVKYLSPGAANNPAALITLPTSVYETSAQNELPFLRQAFLQTYPVTRGYRDDVTLQVVLGYGPNPQDVPLPLRQAMKLLLSHLYYNRGEVPAAVPPAIDHLITPYRLREF